MEVAAIPVSSVAMKACFRNRTMVVSLRCRNKGGGQAAGQAES